MFAIDDDFFGVLVSGLQQAIQQKLNGLERLAIASDEPPAFLGVNLQRWVAAFVGGLFDVDPENEGPKHCGQQIFRRHHRFRFPAGATFSSVGMGCRLFCQNCRILKRFWAVYIMPEAPPKWSKKIRRSAGL